MKYIVDFYKNLDMVNLIIFWGTIIVVLLLLIFSIILANKNKKLRHIIESRGIDIDNYDDDDDELAIKKDIDKENIIVKQEKIKEETNKELNSKTIEEMQYKENNKREEQNNDIPIINETKTEKTKFTPEELVMEYNKNDISKNTLSTTREEKIETVNKIEQPKEEIVYHNPYQKNIVSNSRLNQISQVDIVKTKKYPEEEINKAQELQNNLHYNNNTRLASFEEKNISKTNINSRQAEIAREIKSQEFRETKPKGNYLEEISKSLSKITSGNTLNRTEYELKQEEDAIISYKELMEKKDNIQTVDEEEAVISMEELIRKKQEQDKLYNITNDAEDDKFIDELKNFRSDL